MADSEAGYTVVIGVDKSDQASYAFDYYMQYIHRPGNKVYLIHIPESLTTVTAVQKHYRLSVEDWQRMMDKEQAETEQMMEKFESKLKEAHVDGTYKTFYGKPGEALCDAAKELEAKLVVLGTRGLGSVRRTLLGSVSDYVIHHAHVPVVVCRK